jgi:hypothetical protein
MYGRSMGWGSDNLTGAENQQERLTTTGWVVGFVDGEGCFAASLFRSPKMALGWQVQSIIVPFFKEHRLRTAKVHNFEKFATIMDLMAARRHLVLDGLIEIAEIASTMNHRKPSKVERILRDHTPTLSLRG